VLWIGLDLDFIGLVDPDQYRTGTKQSLDLDPAPYKLILDDIGTRYGQKKAKMIISYLDVVLQKFGPGSVSGCR
jgi:hypothetical protein